MPYTDFCQRPEFKGSHLLSSLLTYQNYLNFRVLEGHTFDRADRLVTVNFQYSRPYDLGHHYDARNGPEKYAQYLARREHESKHEDVTLKDLIDTVQNRFESYRTSM